MKWLSALLAPIIKDGFRGFFESVIRYFNGMKKNRAEKKKAETRTDKTQEIVDKLYGLEILMESAKERSVKDDLRKQIEALENDLRAANRTTNSHF